MTNQHVNLVTTTHRGVHMRVALQLAQLAGRFESKIEVAHAGKVADARSVLALLQLGATTGAQVEIRAEGPDAGAAVASLGAVCTSTQFS